MPVEPSIIDTLTSDDDPIGTRDWEGPIPTSVPTRRRRETVPTLRRARTQLQSLTHVMEQQLQARPFAVLGATLLLGALAGFALRDRAG